MGFFNATFQVRRTDVTTFCMQFFFSRFQPFFLISAKKSLNNVWNEEKRLKTAVKSVLTSFQVCAAPEKWLNSWEPLPRSHFYEIFQFWKIVSSPVPRNARANSSIFPRKLDHLLHFKRSIAFDFKSQKYFWFKQNFKPKVQKVKEYP